MIYGIGNDVIELDRIKKSIENERFLAFCFSEAEREAYGTDHRKLAGCFAAKEALSKALGTGVRGFALDEISVMRDELGKPYFNLSGRIGLILEQKRLYAHLALTNSGNLEIANVILEERE